MIVEALVVALVALFPSDEPIEPVDSTLVALAVTMDSAQPLCDAYAGLIPVIENLGVDAPTEQIFIAMADAYLVGVFEDGMGESSRLTAEAEVVLVDFLHDCGGVVD